MLPAKHSQDLHATEDEFTFVNAIERHRVLGKFAKIKKNQAIVVTSAAGLAGAGNTGVFLTVLQGLHPELLLPCGMVYLAVGVALGSAGLREISDPNASSKVSRKIGKNIRTRLTRKYEKKHGWLPRQGAPHPKGRTDTYERLLPKVSLTEKGFKVYLEQWHYGQNRWFLQQVIQSSVHHVDTEEQLNSKYNETCELAATANEQSKIAWLETQVKEEQKLLVDSRTQTVAQYNAMTTID